LKRVVEILELLEEDWEGVGNTSGMGFPQNTSKDIVREQEQNIIMPKYGKVSDMNLF
jgi:hypothetical protein